jgi:hypothetical protein
VAAEIDAGAKLAQRWSQLDSNDDDSLTVHELGAGADAYQAMDADLDGRVSRAEFYRAYAEGGPA